jgi:phosphoribosylamine--glycine ligase
VVLARMEDDLLPWLEGAAAGRLPAGAPRFAPGAAVCVVLAAANYPGTPRAGDAISLGSFAQDGGAAGPWAFHASTRRDGDGRLVTAGGRVLGIAARGADLAAARASVYGAIGTAPGQIQFSGMHFRTDIGMRGEA